LIIRDTKELQQAYETMFAVKKDSYLGGEKDKKNKVI